MSVSEPGKIITPWAESGLKNTIPPTANPATGRAGFDQGFSAINMTAKEAGGIPPFGQDFNGIFHEVTSILRYMQAGGQPTFDAALATAIGGYPKGAMVIGDDGMSLFRNTVDGNSTNPNLGGEGWARPDLQVMELYRRSYAEAGYNVVGTFQAGFTYVNANDVGIDETTGKGYTGPAGPVAAGTDPTSGGFVDRSGALARPFDISVYDGDINATLAALGAAYVYENISISDDVILASGQTLMTVGDAAITLNGHFIRTAVTASDTYYRGVVGNPLRFLTIAALGGVTLQVSDASGISAGDKLWMRNGYCDHFRFLGTATTGIEKYNWMRKGPYLGEFVTVAGVSGNQLTVRPKLRYSYPLTPIITGLIPTDENARADYAGWTTPSVQKLLYKDITVDVNVVYTSGLAGGIRLDFVDGLDLSVRSSGDSSALPWSCMANYSIFKNVKADSENLTGSNFACISCEGPITGNAVRWNGGTDSPFVSMLMGNTDMHDIDAEHIGTSGERTAAYQNASMRGTIKNVKARNFTSPASFQFSAGIDVENVLGENCDIAAGSYTSVDCTLRHAVLDGYYLLTSVGAGESTLYLRDQSKNRYEKVRRDNDLGFGIMTANVKSEGIKLRDVVAPATTLFVNIGTTATEQAVGGYSLKLDAQGMDVLRISRTSSYYDAATQNGIDYPRVKFQGICRGASSLGQNSAFDEYVLDSYGNVTLGSVSTFNIRGIIRGDLTPVAGQEATCYVSANKLLVTGSVTGFGALTAVITTPPSWWYRGQEVTDMTTMKHYRYTGNRGGGSLTAA